MTTPLHAWSLAAMLSAAATPVVGQFAPQQSVPVFRVSGTIADQQGNPVADAEVSLMQRDTASRFVRSDVNGRFAMDDLSSPTSTIRVRRLGYQARILQIHVTNVDHSATVFVTLEPSVARLSPVLIADDSESILPDPRLVAFYERSRTNNFGHFISEAMLAKMRPHHASEALRSVPGVLIRPSRRIGNMVRLRGCGVPGESSDRVGPLVWVDGVRMPGAELDEVTQGSDLAAIEIYNSYAGIPAQFFDRSAVCGTILVWTKNR
jgi:hypothetical protein